MNKEDLLKLKEFVANLSEEEKKERDIYLAGLANGELQGPPVGYPSIDRVWTKYFDQENLIKVLPKRTVYSELYENNKNHKRDLALEYFGSKINYDKLFYYIERTACSLEELGVKPGDFVTIAAAGMPETVYSFYALSKIGGIANMISPFFDHDDLIKRINECGSDILIVMDSFYANMKDAIKKSRIKKVIVIPTFNSSVLRFFNPKPKVENELLWNDFIKLGTKRKNSKTVEYKPLLPLAMVYSSGTMGSSKGILLSNDSFQNSIQAYPSSGVDVTRGQKFYQIIPPWFSTGLSTSIHLPLSYGVSVLMDPRFEREAFIKNVLNHKPNYAVAPTSMYEAFLDEKLLKNKNISYFNYPFEGGEPLKEEVASKIEGVFANHGSPVLLRTAYGQCECGAAITTQTQKNKDGRGSVGMALPGINIKIVDDNFNELSYYQRGQILVDTPCGMIGYYKNEEANKKYFRYDEVGVKWSCTDDIGYLDKDGNLYVQGRASDFSVINGKKIYNFDLENIIMKFNEIKMCDVLPMTDSNGVCNLAVHIVPNMEKFNNQQDIMDFLKVIQEAIYNELGDVDLVPFIFKIRDNFPYAKSGKRDTRKIMKETDGFITIEKYNRSKVLEKL